MKPSRQTVLKTMIGLLREVVQCDTNSQNGETPEINEKSVLNTLGLNSFERVDLICTLENAYGVMIPDELIFVFETVSDMADYIVRHYDNRFQKIS